MENIHAKYIRDVQETATQIYYDLQDFLSTTQYGEGDRRKLVRAMLSLHDLVNYDQPDNWPEFMEWLNSQGPYDAEEDTVR